MCGVWISVAISGVHDVMYPGGEMWDGDGRRSELDGSVSGCGVRAVPGAMMIKVLDRGKGRWVYELTSNTIEES